MHEVISIFLKPGKPKLFKIEKFHSNPCLMSDVFNRALSSVFREEISKNPSNLKGKQHSCFYSLRQFDLVTSEAE